ncbi:MAG: ferrochelatase [Alphaproteobacteria bacterium]|nr:ferrochelatase [Alphaproteobacteria bacterium]
MKKLAIVAFNMGGPDGPDAVEPFLFNLFWDPAIIGAPTPIRWVLAKLISRRRAPVAREIYEHLGGGSPLVGLTWKQVHALESVLGERLADVAIQGFVCMRYWHPMSAETVRAVKAYGPDEIVLLPLYPQYSTTTSESSLKDWDRAAKAAGLDVPTRRICCYPTHPGFVEGQVRLLTAALEEARASGAPVRVLFSAHGLPKRIVDKKGDPYPWQVEQGAAAIAERMQQTGNRLDDWLVSYQSRVGPLEWIGPSTEDEIARAGRDGKALVVLPVAFVSEHSETLVELDIEYKALAQDAGCKAYVRVPALGIEDAFIDALADMVAQVRAGGCDTSAQGGCDRLCPADKRGCPRHQLG